MRLTATTRVLTCLLLGAVVGMGLEFWNPQVAATVAGIVQPIGRLWLNALQMTVVPLVGTLVILGVSAAADAAATGRTARNAILLFVLLLTLVGIYTVFAAPALLSLLPRDESSIQAFRAALKPVSTGSASPHFGDAIAAIIPPNAIAAAAESAMLPLVVFCLFFGFALNHIEPTRKARLLELVHAICDVMIVIVRWVLWLAPLGVFALVLVVSTQVGVGMLGALGSYIGMQVLLYLSVTLMLYPLVAILGRERIGRYATAILPAQAIAISTQSSLASLPAMVQSARVRLGYSEHISALVPPMAVSLFRITSPVQYLSVAAFVAWMYGMDVSASAMVTGIVLSVIVSLGSIGLPGQVSFLAHNVPVVQAMGLPVEPLSVLLAVDTIPDAFATLGNVSGGMAATAVMARGQTEATEPGDDKAANPAASAGS